MVCEEEKEANFFDLFFSTRNKKFLKSDVESIRIKISVV